MNVDPPKNTVGCLFWLVLAPLVLGVVGTVVGIGYSYFRAARKAEVAGHPDAPSAASNARVQGDGARICAAWRALAPDAGEQGVEADALWKKLGGAAAPEDPWGRPYEWQPWNRSVLSYGPDRTRGTPDDQLVRCEG